MARLTVKPLEHTNVRGKKLYYLSISSGVGEPYVINVGEGTYNECIKMQKEAETQLELSPVEKVVKEGLEKVKEAYDGTKGHVQDKDHKG